MLVRCGRCRVELEVSGAGEFACPNCGTRNVVRGGAAPFDIHDLGTSPPSGLAGIPSTPPPASEPAPGVDWVNCPSCSYRFAVGTVDSVACPTCGRSVTVRETIVDTENG